MSFGQTPGTSDSGIKRIFVTSLSEVSAVDLEGVGAIRREGRKTYKWVKQNQGQGSVAAIAGDCAYYYGLGTDAVSGGYENSEVTMDRTDMYLGAGIYQAIIPHGSYGWIQIRGPATLTQALTGGADGNALTHIGAGADGALNVSAAVTDAVVAYATDATAKKIVCCFPH